MLEDDYSDVLRKAMMGHGLGEDALALAAGLLPKNLQQRPQAPVQRCSD